jgi:organic hydroperoxide reductase OsmC/OhrA
MIKYPVDFLADCQSLPGISKDWKMRSLGQELGCAIPPEFEGPGVHLSPEDLYAQALTNCFVATFKVYAEKSQVSFDSLSCQGRLVVDLDENKKPCMKSFFLKAELRNPTNPEKAKFLADKAFRSGFILNSVKTQLHFDLTVV